MTPGIVLRDRQILPHLRESEVLHDGRLDRVGRRAPSTSSSASARSTPSRGRAGRREPRREQRAAVLVGDDRRLVRAEPLRLARDLFLVEADERPQDRQRRDTRRPRRDSRSSATQPARPTSPVTSACAPALARQALGDAHHQPAIDRRREAAAARRRRPAAGCAPNGTRNRRDLQLVPRQHRARARAPCPATCATGSDSCESARSARGSRGESAATPRPANRCRPRAGTCTLPLVPIGRPPAPGFLVEVEERVVGQHLDADRARRAATDRPASPSPSCTRRPTIALDVRRRDRKPLVGAPRRDAEARRRPARDAGDHGRRRSRRGPARRASRARSCRCPAAAPAASRTSSHCARRRPERD